MTAISILCPTRSRPSRFELMTASALSRSKEPTAVEILAYVDEDDPWGEKYLPSDQVKITRGKQKPVGIAINALSNSARSNILMCAADDVIFRTHDWDSIVREVFFRFEGKPLLAVPLDGMEARKGRRATHMFCSRSWVEAVGYVICPEYEHFFSDSHLEDIARRAGCLYWLDNVLVEHMHPNFGKGISDSTYRAKRGVENKTKMSQRDEVRFRELAGEREEAAKRVAARMEAKDGDT